MILVTGATGATGSELVRRLIARGAPVRCLVRNPAKARTKLGPQVECVEGDLARPETLSRPLQGADRMFLLTGPGPESADLQRNGVEAAKRAGVKHLVKMSAIESVPDSPSRFLRLHAGIEELIRRSGIPFTMLRPHSFMQNMFAFASSIASQGAFYTPPAGAHPDVDVRDIAEVAAVILTSPGHEGTTYTITGPEPLSHSQRAEKIGAAIGKPVRYVEVPPAAAREAMLGMGYPEWIADGVLELNALYASGTLSYVNRVIQEIANKAPITFDEFARDHARMFQGQGAPSPT